MFFRINTVDGRIDKMGASKDVYVFFYKKGEKEEFYLH